MKITQVKLGRISTPLRVPFKTALRTVSSVEDVIVELHTDTGAVGYGEAPPTGVITGDTTGAIIGAIRDHIAPAILGRGLDEFEDLTAAVQKALVHNTSAKAAVDMALWDLLGQKYSAPVYRMLGGARSNIVTDITISVNRNNQIHLWISLGQSARGDGPGRPHRHPARLRLPEGQGGHRPGAGCGPSGRRPRGRGQGHLHPH